MYIQPNRLLLNTARVIKPYACSMIATEGPSIIGKLDMSGVEIPYETQYTTRLILNPGTLNKSLHGDIGNQVTFILLKITYDETDPYSMVEEEQYIEYYYEDQPSVMRYANKLLVLSGNSVKRIPKIYINNPNKVKVVIDALVANLQETEITTNTNDDITLITNLYHNSLISNTFYNSLTALSGSSQLRVIDFEDNVSLYLNYTEIDSIRIEADTYKIIINTKSFSIIHLRFLSLFEMYQAHSRLEWVLESPSTRVLTKDLPSIDTTAPIVYLNTGVTPTIDNIYTIPFTVSGSGTTITKNDIIEHFIENIIDDRDGVISIYDTILKIRKYGELMSIEEITEEGIYEVYMSIADVANNTVVMNYKIVVDMTLPLMSFTQTGNTFSLSISMDAFIPSSGLTTQDVLNGTVGVVTDNLTSMLAAISSTNLSGITTTEYSVNITDNADVEYTNITVNGTYNLLYTVSDLCGNYNFYNKTLIVNS